MTPMRFAPKFEDLARSLNAGLTRGNRFPHHKFRLNMLNLMTKNHALSTGGLPPSTVDKHAAKPTMDPLAAEKQLGADAGGERFVAAAPKQSALV